MLLLHKPDLLENNGPSLTNSGTCQGPMDQIDILKGELKKKTKKKTNICFAKYLKIRQKIHHVLYKILDFHGNQKKRQNTLQNLQTAHHQHIMFLTHLKRTFIKQTISLKKCPNIVKTIQMYN